MSGIFIATASIFALLLLLALGLPIGFSLIAVGFLGLAYLTSVPVALSSIAITFYRVVSEYLYTVLPLFILMGEFANVSGMSSDLYDAAGKWFRKLPGGLALTTVVACAGFAAICGSNAATAATIGTVAIPEMKKLNYDDRLSTGTVAAAGTLGFLIPPSVGFVIYGILAEQSVGKLLIAGIFPGILLALAFMGIVVGEVLINPKLAQPSDKQVSRREKLLALKNVWAVIVIFLIIMGGIYAGIFTPTEAGAVGSTALFLLALTRKKLTFKNLFASLKETILVTSMLFVIILGALIFSEFFAMSELPMNIASRIGELEVPPFVILILVCILLIFLGCFLDSVPTLILSMPTVFPIIVQAGYNPIWFGVIAILLMNTGSITPPVGLNVYIVGAIAKDVSLFTIFRGAMPFLIAIVAVIIILALVPDIALYLTRLMR